MWIERRIENSMTILNLERSGQSPVPSEDANAAKRGFMTQERLDSGTAAIDLASYRHPRPFSYLVKRGLWACFQLPFWSATPRALTKFRIALLRLFGAKIGRNCRVNCGVRVWEPWNLVMGDYAVLGDSVEVYNLAPIDIGSNSVISQRTYLCSATHDYTDTSFPLYSKPIRIGSSVWVAAGAFVGPGVTLGDGAVIGAFSVVTRDMPEWMVCAGNPCRPIKPRELRTKME